MLAFLKKVFDRVVAWCKAHLLAVMIIAAIIILVLAIIFGIKFVKNSSAQSVTPTSTVSATATLTATFTPMPTATIQPTATVAPTATTVARLSSGVYLNWSKDADKYRQSDGTYIIPVSDLQKLYSSAFAILFEGEFFDTIGTHNVCYVTGGYSNSCKVVDGKIHINQGSFWGYLSVPNGEYLPDDLLAISAHNKWKNWDEQGIKGNIQVYVSTGTVSYLKGEEPKLTPVQKLMSNQDVLDRCSADKPQLLENPFSDAFDQTNLIVVGAPGSFGCRTLFVGKLTASGDLMSYYWTGAKDGFSYVASATSFYIIPQSWGEKEMKVFVATLGKANFLGQYIK